MESSRRDLLNDMVEHKAVLKNNQNTYQPLFGFTPKTGTVYPRTGVLFLLWWRLGHKRSEMRPLNFKIASKISMCLAAKDIFMIIRWSSQFRNEDLLAVIIALLVLSCTTQVALLMSHAKSDGCTLWGTKAAVGRPSGRQPAVIDRCKQPNEIGVKEISVSSLWKGAATSHLIQSLKPQEA